MEVTNRYVAIKHQINGSPKESDFELKSVNLALSIEAGSNYVLVKNIYVSIDPYQINRFKDYSSFQTEKIAYSAVEILPGKAINAYGVGKVVESGDPEFQKGDFVVGFIGWEEYSLVQGGATYCALRKIDSSELPLSNHVGILGIYSYSVNCKL